jgi:Na+-translocating ferredoxin:NAD+ oxidoreductase RNF subunit RnfB
MTVWIAIAVLGGMGVLFGVGLSLAGVKFKIEEDPRYSLIMDVLPKASCGGCGYPGCGGFALAVIAGDAPPEGCPVGGFPVAQAVGEIMRIEVKELPRQCAFVRCGGGESKSAFLYHYDGMNRCFAAMQLAAGGAKTCRHGCLGGATCVEACAFDAMHIVDGIAKVDNEKCTACGKCVPVCPKKLIVMVPYASKVRVACHATDDAKTVRANCKVGCISCKLCEKACKEGAIKVEDNYARIDYEKCVNCGACVEKCPEKCITVC